LSSLFVERLRHAGESERDEAAVSGMGQHCVPLSSAVIASAADVAVLDWRPVQRLLVPENTLNVFYQCHCCEMSPVMKS
jgi:hypothetical protein